MHSYRYYGTVPRRSPSPPKSFIRDNSITIIFAGFLVLVSIAFIYFVYQSALDISSREGRLGFREGRSDVNDEPEPIERRLNTTASKGYGPESVKNFAGYVTVNQSQFFYWFFESRENPSQDPFILWMTGGPGCSGLFALFNENGPYKIQENLSLELNPYSWNARANIIWIDQPVGTGFSYSDDISDTLIYSQEQVAEYMYQFLQVFFKSYPEYGHLPLYIFGESYGGHYVPALARRILVGNERVKTLNGVKALWQEGKANSTEGSVLELQGISIGSGIVDPYVQFSYNTEYARDHLRHVLNESELKQMEYFLPQCLSRIKSCDYNASFDDVCLNAFVDCNGHLVNPIRDAGINYYDIRKKCIESEPFCYNFYLTTEFLQQSKIQRALGTDGREWTFCNANITLNFVQSGDFMLSYADTIPLLLQNEVRVLVFNGDADYVSHWYGAQAWVNNMNWSGHNTFTSSPVTEWFIDGQCKYSSTVPYFPSPSSPTSSRIPSPPSLSDLVLNQGGKKSDGTTKPGVCGWYQSAQGLTFVRIREAGHLVSMDQPLIALTLINTFIHNTPLTVLAYLS